MHACLTLANAATRKKRLVGFFWNEVERSSRYRHQKIQGRRRRAQFQQWQGAPRCCRQSQLLHFAVGIRTAGLPAWKKLAVVRASPQMIDKHVCFPVFNPFLGAVTLVPEGLWSKLLRQRSVVCVASSNYSAVFRWPGGRSTSGRTEKK